MLLALIEDDVSIACLIMTTLQLHGKTVRHFLDGASFFASLQTTSYDLVLTDFDLPGDVSGLQVITFLQESMPTVPILVVSGADKSLHDSLQTLHPRLSILRKPFHIQALLQSIETLQRPP